jgi:hypothetical protein
MNDSYSKWSDVRAKGRAADPRTAAEPAAGRALAKDATRPTSEAISCLGRPLSPPAGAIGCVGGGCGTGQSSALPGGAG